MNEAKHEVSGKDASPQNAPRSSGGNSLSDQRTSGRTLGCVGFSTILHAGLLIALAIAPLAIREAGGDNAGSHDGGVSMAESQPMSVEMTDASAPAVNAAAAAKIADNQITAADGSQTVDVSVMTDENSDIEMPKKVSAVKKAEVVAAIIPLPEKPVPKVEIKPIEKSVAKPVPKTVAKAKPVVAAKPVVEAKVIETESTDESPVIAKDEEQNETAPVLLANPPSDDEVAPEKTETPEVKKPEVVAVKAVEKPVQKPVEKKAEKPVEKPVAVIAKKVEAAPSEEKEVTASKPVAAAPVQSKSHSEDSESHGAGGNAAKEEENEDAGGTGGTSAAAMSSGSSNGQNEEANGKEGDGASAGAVAGPIRDASELKALSGNPNPVYPARDRLAHKEGTAVVLGRVSADGRVTEVSVERSSGSANMDSASLQAFRSWRFQAGQQGWVRKPFQFRLVGDAKEVPAPLGKGLTR